MEKSVTWEIWTTVFAYYPIPTTEKARESSIIAMMNPSVLQHSNQFKQGYNSRTYGNVSIHFMLS